MIEANGPASDDAPQESANVPLPYDWSATFTQDGPWTVARLHPGPRPYGDVIGLAIPLWQEMERRWATLLVLEMDEVDFLSSSLMGELVRLYKRIAGRSGALRLCGLQPECAEALRVCRLDEVLPAYVSHHDATHS
ncbi:MAG: STAS domain-containing protein [Planctomycetota bacterium]